jgi:hypothetical protein
VHGPERGRLIGEVRGLLEAKFKNTDGLSPDLFKKRIDRIIWELVCLVSPEEVMGSLSKILA